MPLTELAVGDLRCIESAELRFSPGVNVLHGANGAGKTSLLEAIFLLGRGRSFRTRINERLIRHGCQEARVIGRLGDERSRQIGLGFRRTAGARADTTIRVDGRAAEGLAELATTFPVQILDPDAHKLIEESAGRRRRWLDWSVFHVEPVFGKAWTRYQRALAQRNAALKARQSPSMWDTELVKEGEVLTASRRQVVEALQPYWSRAVLELTGLEIQMSFHAGWDRQQSLQDSLTQHLTRDRERGSTGVGPHRADLSLRYQGKMAKEVLSRGQQKLTAVALALAQLEFLKDTVGLLPTVLLDDPSAELDQAHLERFIGRIQSLRTQLIVTALERNFGWFGAPESVFHVERGQVFRV
jgi:DNA replication and repair protein RecF